MEELKMPLLTTNHTKVMVFDDNHSSYSVVKAEDENMVLGSFNFQYGPIADFGVNGINNEDIINIVIDRLQHFQRTEYKCRENALAITKLEEALLWLRCRTMRRESEGKLGTSKV